MSKIFYSFISWLLVDTKNMGFQISQLESTIKLEFLSFRLMIEY